MHKDSILRAGSVMYTVFGPSERPFDEGKQILGREWVQRAANNDRQAARRQLAARLANLEGPVESGRYAVTALYDDGSHRLFLFTVTAGGWTIND